MPSIGIWGAAAVELRIWACLSLGRLKLDWDSNRLRHPEIIKHIGSETNTHTKFCYNLVRAYTIAPRNLYNSKHVMSLKKKGPGDYSQQPIENKETRAEYTHESPCAILSRRAPPAP